MFARLVFLRWGRAEGVRTTCRVRGVCVCRGKCNGATPPWAFHKRKRAPPEPGFYWEPRCVTKADAHARGRSDYFTIGRYYRVVGDAPRRGGRGVRGASPGESAEKKELREETT